MALADAALEDTLYDSKALQRFARIDLATEGVSDATTMLKFLRLLEIHDPCKGYFAAPGRETRPGSTFVAATVRANESLSVRAPSLTVTVIIVEPLWLIMGVTVTVRLVSLPPKAMLAFGMRLVLEEVPVRDDAAVSKSPMVNDRFAIGAQL
jgi:hypothetical protein